MDLRPYQNNDLDKVRSAMKHHYRRVLLQASCGYGKTIVSAEIAKSAISKGKKVLFLDHRRDLTKQTEAKFESYGLGNETGVIMSGVESNLDRPIQIATVQTYSRRLELDDLEVNRWFHDADLVVSDEVHMFGAPTYKAVLETHSNAFHLGLSATPFRKGTPGYGLGNMFDILIHGEPMSKLIRDGYLLPPVHYSLERNEEKILRGDLLDNWARLAGDRQTIVFAKNVSQSKAIRDRFQYYGISVAHIDSHTKDEDREIIYNGFNSGEIQVLTNCNIATEGSDFPCCSCVVIAKNVSSLPRYLQMGGRPARPFKDQKDYLVLDHSGCVERFGRIDDEYEWTLDTKVIAVKNKTVKKERKAITCEKCSHIFYYKEKCPMCFTPVTIKNQFIETTDEDLVLVGNNRKKKISTDELRRWHGMFKTWWSEQNERRAKQGKYLFKPGWVAYKFKDKFGVWPNKYPSDPIMYDDGFINYMVHLNIKYAKSKRKQGS